MTIRDKLSATCLFPECWEHMDGQYPANELGYFRADYDGSCWWNTAWPVHDNLKTPELVREFDEVYFAFRREFPNLDAVRKFCAASAGKTDEPDEFNAYLEGEHGNYWFRFITRQGDYNLYLHCLRK